MSKLKVDLGEAKLDTRVHGTGTLRFCTKLSPSFALFALDLEHEIDYGKCFKLENIVAEQGKIKILDVILTRKDGWTKEMIDEMLNEMATSNRTIYVSGYPERREAEIKGDTNIFCVHAVDVKLIETSKIYRREPPQEVSGVQSLTTTTIETSPNVNKPDATNADSNSKTENNNNVADATSPGNDYHRLHIKKPANKRQKNSDRGANDNSRFAKVAFFLLSEFGGYDGLKSLPVLDVAGGSGGLAFEL
ncbi:MAG: hypothetical protein SGBAC_010298, partial [Bacillariaceae sp.]